MFAVLGNISIRMVSSSWGSSSTAPSLNHRRTRAYQRPPFSIFRPPPCGKSPVAFRKNKLVAGAATFTRRPRAALTTAAKSNSSSNPNRLNWKPFWPSAFPWQPPELQAAFVRIGWISRLKLIGLGSVKCCTFTWTTFVPVLLDTRTSVNPSPTGRTTPRSFTTATSSFFERYFELCVKSISPFATLRTKQSLLTKVYQPICCILCHDELLRTLGADERNLYWINHRRSSDERQTCDFKQGNCRNKM